MERRRDQQRCEAEWKDYYRFHLPDPMRWSSSLSACLVAATFASSAVEAASLRGASKSCSAPPGIYQGTVSYSSLRPGSRATYKCIIGCYMVGNPSITCNGNGGWSDGAPECRVQYDKRNDNSYKNNDKGYKLYSG